MGIVRPGREIMLTVARAIHSAAPSAPLLMSEFQSLAISSSPISLSYINLFAVGPGTGVGEDVAIGTMRSMREMTTRGRSCKDPTSCQ